jgi:general secretion pathway protein H
MRKEDGFTLLEMLIVLFLMTLIVGIATVYFANRLPSSRFTATARELAASMRYARSLAQIKGEAQTLTLDLDAKKYGIEGRPEKSIPADVNVKVVDPVNGDIVEGAYRFVFPAFGGAEGGTVVLWNDKKSVSIDIDPVVGAVVAQASGS